MYVEVEPRHSAPFVEAFWLFENRSGSPAAHPVVPDARSDLVVHLAGPERAEFIGCMTRTEIVRAAGGTVMAGVRFRPGAVHALSGLPMHEITDLSADPRDLLGRRWLELHATLRRESEKEPGRVIPILDRWLARVLAGQGGPTPVSLAARAIQDSNGLAPLKNLASELGLSVRHLQRLFLLQVGLSPKLFARVTRFQAVHRFLSGHGLACLAQAALDAGYYDQAHFNRDYKEFAGVPPTHEQMSHLYKTNP